MVNLLAPMLRRVAQRYEKDVPNRSDLQQEMLIAVWLSLESYEKSSSFRSWVNEVAHSVGSQHVALRRAGRFAERLGGDLLEASPNQWDAESLVSQREQIQILFKLLDGLRPREREAVLLDMQEFDIREMSNEMKLSQSQVRDSLVRARRRLMLWMKKHEAANSEEAAESARNGDDEPSPPVARSWAARIREAGGPIYFIAPPRK